MFERNFVGHFKPHYKAIFVLFERNFVSNSTPTILRLNETKLVDLCCFERKIVGENREEAMLFERSFVRNSR